MRWPATDDARTETPSPSAETVTGRPTLAIQTEDTILNCQQTKVLFDLYNVKNFLQLSLKIKKEEAWKGEKKEEETEIETGTYKWRIEQRVWEAVKSGTTAKEHPKRGLQNTSKGPGKQGPDPEQSFLTKR